MCSTSLPEGKPAGYKKRKRDEHSPPRMAIQMGKPKVCQVCYRPKRGYVDVVCAVCLGDWNALQKLEKEIAMVFPASAKLTTPQIFRRLWERSQAATATVKKLKEQIAALKERRSESLEDLIGRVGFR